jgi:hypothetical protein
MTTLEFLLVLVVTSGLVGYAGLVAALVLRADFYSKPQKAMQIALILLLPLVGTILVHWFLRLHMAKPEKADGAFIRQEQNIDDLRGLH